MSAWIELSGLVELYHWIDQVGAELRKNPQFWEPYQTVDEVLHRIDNGTYQLWYGGVESHEICMWGITETRRFNDFATVTVLWCSGEHGPEFYGLWMKGLERFCEIMKLDRIVIEAGRKGWERIFEPLGFRVAAIELVKDIEHVPEAAE